MEKFDVFVFGTGSAGQYVAKSCAEKGLKTAIVDKREYGGVCALRGCDPKKLMLTPIMAYAQSQDLMGDGLKGDLQLDWDGIRKKAKGYTQEMPEQSEQSLKKAGVACLHGKAVFVDKHTVELDGNKYQADSFVIATGLKTLDLGIEGQELMNIYEDFFTLNSPPEEVVFAGGGYISMEFGNMLMRAGSKVTIIEKSDQILSPFEKTLADRLENHLSDLDVNFIKNAEVSRIKKCNGKLHVTYDEDDEKKHIDCDVIFNCAGRVPQIDELGLKNIGLETVEKGVSVNNQMQSISHPHIYACGDVSAKHLPLTPLSSREAKTVVANILGKQETIDRDVIPSVVFTIPQFASVGMTSEQAKKSGHDVEIVEKDGYEFYNNQRVNGSKYHFVLILEKQTEKILGAHILGPEAAEQINLLAFAMTHGITYNEFEKGIFTYPSWSNDLLSIR